MTNQTDNDSNGRTAQEKQNAEVMRRTPAPPADPEFYWVKYPDNDTPVTEPATPKNIALFEDNLFEQANGSRTFQTGGEVLKYEGDVANDRYALTLYGERVAVPSEHHIDVIEAFQSKTTARDLYDLYHTLIQGQVRRSVVKRFLDLFPDDRVEVTPDGWVVDDTFLVDWDGTNYLTTEVEVWSVSGSQAVAVDESKQAVYLGINAEDETTLRAPDGESVMLSATEQEFLTTVEALLFPEDYFGVELVDEVRQYRDETDAKSLFSELASEAEVNGFTDSKTGQFHGSSNHSFGKHKLEYEGVTDEVVDLLWSHGYDHAGVHEMLYRKNEFIGRPDLKVFEDADDDDEQKWDRLASIADGATISPQTRQKLQEMYGSRDH